MFQCFIYPTVVMPGEIKANCDGNNKIDDLGCGEQGYGKGYFLPDYYLNIMGGLQIAFDVLGITQLQV
ncbi:MAG: hypothetical protein JRI42_06520 [Deltaproteobacteria bacterium]|nr:hypothetical protein [Deltaproteobacteria bacterium]